MLSAKLDLDMIGIGPFIPHGDTPLQGLRRGTSERTLRAVAICRLVLDRAHMPATTALGTIDTSGRQKALKCGANVLMPNVTPLKYKKLYSIYPGKICITEKAEECRGCMGRMLGSLNRTIATGYGHALNP
jgi:biotin synthase